MTPTQVLALINSLIVSNGVGAITGPILNSILVAIVGLFTSPAVAARLVGTSTTLNLTTDDYAVGVQRTINLAPFTVNLPAGTQNGQTYKIQDLSGNFSQYPVTVVPPGGATINGRANYVMNEDNQTAYFQFYGTIWGVDPA